ncbi:ribosome small subunit-dependent GTPase A [filamentous cyanobacterium CCP5]|nr:ribosome small subunit-dependent GTPase A [filamentous cyanobacterium CCP5]
MVLAAQANYYWVRLDSVPPTAASQALLCTRRARLKKMGQQVMVGDRVRIEEADWIGGRGAIAEVAPRRSVLDRPPVANADQILLVFALAEPSLDSYQLSRFLIKAEATDLSVQLCLTKRDLVEPGVLEQWRQRLQAWGYAPLAVSLFADADQQALRNRLAGHVTVLSGPSGVGKSSLINRLAPEADLRTSSVSGKLGRGRHTTRHVELFELPDGLLADTPGFNQPDIACSPEALENYFPEIRQRLARQSCQFSDCLHRDEPGCAVGTDWERHEIYLSLLDEAIAHQSVRNQQADPEAAYKVKSTVAGQTHREPRLQAKKYRRVSRRSTNQTLQELCDELTHSLESFDDGDQLEDFNSTVED